MSALRLTAFPELRNFSGRFHFNYEFLLPILNTFTFNTEEYFTEEGISYNVNDAKAVKNLYHNSSIF